MRVLGVDTTSAKGSVAVLEGYELRGQREFQTPEGHAQRLLPEIERLLESMNLSLGDLAAFAVAVGPGSFTGLRIGIASIEGLAFATGRPVAGVSTLEAIAYRYRSRGGLVAPFVDARREEVFGALYRVGSGGQGDGSLYAEVEPVCERPANFLTRLAGHAEPSETIVVAGDGLGLYRVEVEKILGARAEIAGSVSDLAEEVARLGQMRLAEGRAAPLGTLKAQYLRAPDAERPR